MIASRHRITPALAAATVAAAVLVSSCSGSNPSPNAQSSNNAGSQASTTPSMAGHGSDSAPPTTSAAAGSTAEAPTAPQGPNAVNISDLKFVPATLTVPVGTSVTWTNNDKEPHAIAAKDGSFHGPEIDTHGSWSFTFATPGSYDYICSIHPFMTGTVVVTKWAARTGLAR
jgi:plastocyanin